MAMPSSPANTVAFIGAYMDGNGASFYEWTVLIMNS